MFQLYIESTVVHSLIEFLTHLYIAENKTLGRALDPRANGAQLSKRTE